MPAVTEPIRTEHWYSHFIFTAKLGEGMIFPILSHEEAEAEKLRNLFKITQVVRRTNKNNNRNNINKLTYIWQLSCAKHHLIECPPF